MDLAFLCTKPATRKILEKALPFRQNRDLKSGIFIRCNSDGTETYGTAKTIDAMGACTFDFVPFGTAEAPIHVYVKQLTLDETHNVHPGVVAVSMSEPNQTQYVQNTPDAFQSFTFADANYAGLNLNGTLTFEGPQES